ncbi:transcription-repair coupling factor [Cytophagales bacterium LB-30]|uniref:Transcription-repair-coupling factor n=1 Tax=Shiella aurantiaca TaxID=3058365 RepID=A0ABT8F6M4_9BACT|nr:transcription-repair coupling factor [Shiella aurantiaca]MDN4165621.1 transcription-repair coupling factor [Shiella aurantiaca]
MKNSDLLSVYQGDSLIKAISESMRKQARARVQLKGLKGSLDAVVAACLHQLGKEHQWFVMHDKEEAYYFQYDLQNLLGHEVLMFPSSYKKPYQFEETENANILMRAEVLNRIQSSYNKSGLLIVSYPEALTEKVINKQSLTENTFSIKIGEKLDTNFLSELLISYEFEKAEFVYEAGQFAVRGGIIDIFSYANEKPYRLELFGNEVESIRTFDPQTQLSVDQVEFISLVPNMQTKLLQEKRQSLLEFIPDSSQFWFKDLGQVFDVLEEYFDKASANFNQILKASGNTKVVLKPEEIFETPKSFQKGLEAFTTIEFGNRFHFRNTQQFSFETETQPSFNKNFELLKNHLDDYQQQGYSLVIASESAQQTERLRTIFAEIDPFLKFSDLNISLRNGFVDKQMKVLCYTDHQLFDRYYRYKIKEKHSKSKALTLKELKTLQPGDYVTHTDYGVGRFAGLELVDVGGKQQEAIRLVYRDDDLLYVSIHSLHKISKYSGKEGTPPPISKLGSPDWENKKKRVKKQVADIAKDLIMLYAKRKATQGFRFSADGFMQAELESSFIYEDTPDQAKATADVKADMEEPHPMDRLVCGDVGFGKTEVAIRAAFKAVNDGKQAAVLVPTTILAMQHYRTFSERLSNLPVKVAYINRFKSTKEIKDTLKQVKEGKVDILIGTHRIVNKDVEFKDLGLMIIDEEQKFGVKVKERLKEMRVNIDALTLTATPIPRTLQFSLMGARDLSIIATPPSNRQPVTTEIHTFNNEIIRDAVSNEINRGGQVFFVHNRISDIEEIANLILKLVPDARICIGHGQMDGEKLEKVMMKFIEGEYDVLVSTNIIESGLDIPNANTIMINRAHMFGLSDLHQMRGRVGRSNKKAYCYLLTPPTSALTVDSRKRLSALEEFSDLGDGFKVAMRDLDIRGAGNLLGAEQSGFITDIGFDMYHKLLDETIQELKETEFKDLFIRELSQTTKALVVDCSIETDMEILIPENYVSNISERLNLYAKLDSIKNEEGLAKFTASLLDRFGPLPDTVLELIETVRLRWLAEKLGFEKVSLKRGNMKCYFVPAENERYYKSDVFGKVLAYVQKHSKICKMKEHKSRLILNIDEVESINRALQLLSEMAA